MLRRPAGLAERLLAVGKQFPLFESRLTGLARRIICYMVSHEVMRFQDSDYDVRKGYCTALPTLRLETVEEGDLSLWRHDAP